MGSTNLISPLSFVLCALSTSGCGQCEGLAEETKETARGDRAHEQDAQADKERRECHDEQVATHRTEYKDPKETDHDAGQRDHCVEQCHVDNSTVNTLTRA